MEEPAGSMAGCCVLAARGTPVPMDTVGISVLLGRWGPVSSVHPSSKWAHAWCGGDGAQSGHPTHSL